MRTEDFGMPFFGRRGFGFEEIKNLREQWSTMSEEEKEALIRKRVEAMNEMCDGHDSFEKRFSVEAIDAKCAEWIKKTPEEKETFIKERKEAMHERHQGFWGGRGFGFCHKEGEHQL